MKRSSKMKTYFKPTMLACAMVLASGQASAAVDAYLATKAFTKTMPGGTLVPMWGYVNDTGDGTNAHCYDITGAGSAALRNTCVANLPDPVIPGPELAAGVNDPNFRIFLTNGLSEGTSIVITGQEMPWSNSNNGPTWNDDSIGSRTTAAQRVRTFGREAAANGGRMSYLWTNFHSNPFVKSGSFIYHSGTTPQNQVYMGLYGAVTKDAAASVAYDATLTVSAPVAYDNQVTLFYSDIDPNHNAAVAAGDSSYTPIHYHAQWFLINGEPYVEGLTTDINLGNAGDNTLVRFLSAGAETYVPTLQGLRMNIHAEDGNVYTYQDGASEYANPRDQWSVQLQPLKTKDVIINAPSEGRFAIYEGTGALTNPSDPEDFNVDDTVGGMLRFMNVTAGAVPAGAECVAEAEIKHDGVDQDCNGYDLTIDITRARYRVSSDGLNIWATSELGQQAQLNAVVTMADGNSVTLSMWWNSTQGRWQKWVGNFSTKHGAAPVSVAVTGMEGSDSIPVEER